MKLQDIKGVKHYLENDCYCQYEIYESNGFFCKLFQPDLECKYLGKTKTYHMVICKDQILLFYIHKDDENKIVDSVIYDATKNNIEICVLLAKGKQVSELIKEKRKMDKFSNNMVKQDLKKILQMADAVMIDRRC